MGLSYHDMAPRIGEAFTVAFEGGEQQLVLVGVSEIAHSPRPEGGFRLEFRGPRAPVLPQAIYPFSGSGDALEIFIVPVGQDADGTLYEAVFF